MAGAVLARRGPPPGPPPQPHREAGPASDPAPQAGVDVAITDSQRPMHRRAPVVEPGKPDHLAPRHPVPNRDPDLAEIRVGGPHRTPVIDGPTEHPGAPAGGPPRPPNPGGGRTGRGGPLPQAVAEAAVESSRRRRATARRSSGRNGL